MSQTPNPPSQKSLTQNFGHSPARVANKASDNPKKSPVGCSCRPNTAGPLSLSPSELDQTSLYSVAFFPIGLLPRSKVCRCVRRPSERRAASMAHVGLPPSSRHHFRCTVQCRMIIFTVSVPAPPRSHSLRLWTTSAPPPRACQPAAAEARVQMRPSTDDQISLMGRFSSGRNPPIRHMRPAKLTLIDSADCVQAAPLTSFRQSTPSTVLQPSFGSSCFGPDPPNNQRRSLWDSSAAPSRGSQEAL